ncbi:GNAT family N-acetyltransferase [Prosthecomicrobium hirschii]|uniref:GNAT family N-acetyltransferase n=1 Tax=Prosthecodimorpha hirschii TaxID=665126 RepID=UPI0022201186|nr:GNAT family N-acetyltransferase [Prosthecomicrobium hirschii]MCW1840871.1 GNAT family N-acetyltransferase [Prosthecomicrobium hirschii]
MHVADFTIRPAEPGDLPGILAIYALAVETGLASFELAAPDLDEMTRRHAAIVGAGFPYLVAERDGAVLGYSYAGPYRPRPAYRFTVENSVYVAEAARGRGVGRALIAALIEACAARGVRQMVAVIGDSANDASIRLHASAGFEHAGLMRSVGFKFGRWVDSVLMQRPIGAGDATLPG